MLAVLFLVAAASSACELPGAPQNGQVIADRQPANQTGATVAYACNDGFAIWGHASQVCRSDGSWNPPGPPPSCLDKLVADKLFRPSSGATFPNGYGQPVVESRTVQRCTWAFRNSPWLVVEQRDVLPVFVVKMALSTNVASSPPMVTVTVRVGNYSAGLRKNPVCVVIHCDVVIDRVLYLQCSEVLRGRFVILHVRSRDPVSVCELVTYAAGGVPVPSHDLDSSYGEDALIGFCFGLAFVVIFCCLVLEAAKSMFRTNSYESF